ncbi:MAG: hypothetical protein ACERKZ_12245 [Lachnotalea sp.]
MNVNGERLKPQVIHLFATTKSSVIISNVSKPIKYTFITSISDYVAAPGTISVTGGTSTTVSSSISGGVKVGLDLLQSNVASTLGASTTFTTTQTITYTVPSRHKGRIVLKYSQDYYTFKETKRGKEYNCSGYTAAYNGYYTLQKILL